MICKACCQAADWITAVSSFKEDVDYARMMHGRCAGATSCDCQHKVDAQVAGKSVQR